MQRPEKEKIVAELTERLRTSETLIVADYRGLSV
jgi:ribosomal protein L10